MMLRQSSVLIPLHLFQYLERDHLSLSSKVYLLLSRFSLLQLLHKMLEKKIPSDSCCLVVSHIKIDSENEYNKTEELTEKVKVQHSAYILDELIPRPGDIINGNEKSKSKENNNQSNNEVKFLNPIPKTGWRRYIGSVLIIISTMTYSLGTLCIKILQDKGYHPFSLSYIRFQGLSVPAVSLMCYYRCINGSKIYDSITPLNNPTKLKTFALLILRSFIGCTSTIFHIFALQYISLADASVIAFSCPVFVVVFAHILGMEKMGYTSFLVALFTLSGVALICHPPILTGSTEFDTKLLIGSALAFGCMLCGSTIVILVRKLRNVHFSVMMSSYGLFGALECAVFVFFSKQFTVPQGMIHWGYCLGLIGFTSIAQIALIAGLKYEEAGPAALVQTTDCIFSFVWQYFAFGLIPDMYSLGGAGIVISGVAIISFRKIISNLPPNNSIRERFQFLLK